MVQFTFSSKKQVFFPFLSNTVNSSALAVNAVFRKQVVYHCMHGGFARLILAGEHFSDLSRTGRLSTSLILQFAGWNSRPCSSLPPPNNGNPLSTSRWPTTWLIKTCLESRCQLTVKPIKPNSAPHRKQSLPPWLWIFSLVKGPKTLFLMVNATSSISTCDFSHWWNQCTYLNVSNYSVWLRLSSS